MKKLILLVGIPGSGKSTVAKRLSAKGFKVLNADAIREELWGDAADQKDPEKVFGTLYKRLEALLGQQEDIVIDNTNLSPKIRKPILDRARKAGYSDVQLWLLDVPLEVCLDRNRERHRNVPEDVVANMFIELSRTGRPRDTEGKLVIIRPGKDKNDFRIFYPENS